MVLICLTSFFSMCRQKRTPISYELPKGFSGWVTVRYEKPNAPPLVQNSEWYHIRISDSGFAETSSVLENGMATDVYYWMDGENKVVLPEYTSENTAMIHAEVYSSVGFENFVSLDTLEIGKEITLPDGGKVTRLDDKGGVSAKSGRYLLYRFYVSEKLKNIQSFANYELPPLPKEHEKW